MPKRLLPIFFLCLALLLIRRPLSAQGNAYQPQLLTYTGVPTSVCDTHQAGPDVNTGTFYSCSPKTRTWVNSRISSTTVAGLPTPASAKGQVVYVTDGTSGTDCATGGSSTLVVCFSTGASWIALPQAAGTNTFSGPNTFTGNLTAAGQSIIATKSLNNVVSCDGVAYTGSSALQNAILALPAGGGTVDCSNPNIGTQTLTSDPTSSITGPIHLRTGPYTIQADMTAFCGIALPSGSTVKGENTLWFNSTAQSDGAFCNDTSGRSAQQGTGILNNRIYGTTASTTSGSNVITVGSASNLQVGQTIGILGCSNLGTGQQTTINQVGGIGSGDSSVTVTATNLGVPAAFSTTTAYQDNYLIIDSEIMSYSGLTATSFTGLTRGLFGTTAASHSNGAKVTEISDLISEITAISGTSVTMLDNCSTTLTGAFVQAGAMNILFDGNMVFDTNYTNRASNPSPGPNWLFGISLLLGSNITVGPNIIFRNSAMGGVMAQATRKSNIGGHYRHIGRPPQAIGSDVWLFSSSKRNTVRTSSHDDGDIAIIIDDRSDIATRFAGGSNDNTVSIGRLNGRITYSDAIDIEGFSSGNQVIFGHVNPFGGGPAGAAIQATGQWTGRAPIPTGNTIIGGQIDSAGTAISTTGSSGNLVLVSRIPTGTISVNSNDNTVSLTDDWACGRCGTVLSCTSATIIGSGGGVPVTFTLPSFSNSYTLECEGVVGQATAATANNWNLLAVTNGATNITAYYRMDTPPTATAGGATTDQASTATTFSVGPTWTLGSTGAKMRFHVWAKIEGASASGTVLSLQLVAPTPADLVTIYRGSACKIY